MKKQSAIRLEKEDWNFLRELGNGQVSQGVRELINEKKKRLEGTKEKEKQIDEKFYETIYLPSELHLKETYKAFLEGFIRNGERRGTVDYYIPLLTGTTGENETTLRKQFRKLTSIGFVKADGLKFRPRLKLGEETDKEEFKSIYTEFKEFLDVKGKYHDFGEELWE